MGLQEERNWRCRLVVKGSTGDKAGEGEGWVGFDGRKASDYWAPAVGSS